MMMMAMMLHDDDGDGNDDKDGDGNDDKDGDHYYEGDDIGNVDDDDGV